MPSKKKQAPQVSISSTNVWILITVTVFLFGLVIFNFWRNRPLAKEIKLLLTAVDFTTYMKIYSHESSESGKNLILDLSKNIWGADVTSFQQQEEKKIYSKIRPLENFIKNQGPNAPILRELANLYRLLGKEKTALQYENKAKEIDPISEIFAK